MMQQTPGELPFSFSCSNCSLSMLDVMLSSLYLSLLLRGMRLAIQKLNASVSEIAGLLPARATSSTNLECLPPTAMALCTNKNQNAFCDETSAGYCPAKTNSGPSAAVTLRTNSSQQLQTQHCSILQMATHLANAISCKHAPIVMPHFNSKLIQTFCTRTHTWAASHSAGVELLSWLLWHNTWSCIMVVSTLCQAK